MLWPDRWAMRGPGVRQCGCRVARRGAGRRASTEPTKEAEGRSEWGESDYTLFRRRKRIRCQGRSESFHAAWVHTGPRGLQEKPEAISRQLPLVCLLERRMALRWARSAGSLQIEGPGLVGRGRVAIGSLGIAVISCWSIFIEETET
jgi:hypothetical protein